MSHAPSAASQEWQEDLQRVLPQDGSPPVAWEDLEPVVVERLGKKRLAELEIDPEPMAAASLGQVHRAKRKSDGLELCVKIQYPRLADAIDSDIRTLTQIVRLARLVPKGMELNAIMEEVREMIYLGPGHDKGVFGRLSPGPAADPYEAAGQQRPAGAPRRRRRGPRTQARRT